jgi:hypothetical protein
MLLGFPIKIRVYIVPVSWIFTTKLPFFFFLFFLFFFYIYFLFFKENVKETHDSVCPTLPSHSVEISAAESLPCLQAYCRALAYVH